jgi:hypothetical protein
MSAVPVAIAPANAADLSIAQAAPLAAAQHKVALFADAELLVYAVIMGERVGDLASRLAAADVVDFDCLVPGALEPEVQRRAPYLALLKPESAFTDWLLFEAGDGFGDWGLLVRGTGRLLAMRKHLRGLLEATLPGGQTIAFDWMDPELLFAVLPLFGAAELTAFFGPVRTLVVPGNALWRHAEVRMGRLARRDVAMLKAA